MTFEEFRVVVLTELTKMLDDGLKAELKEVTKTNDIIEHGILITGAGSRVSPIFYLDSFYEEFREGRTIGDIVENLKKLYEKYRIDDPSSVESFSDFSWIKDRIYMKVLNRERNGEIMKKAPFLELLDLIVVFYIKIEDDNIGHGTVLVLNDHLKLWGKTREELYGYALINEKKAECGLCSLKDFLIKEMEERGEDSARAEGLEDVPMYLITNKEKLFGASKIADPELLKNVRESFDSDYYIIPSSIHELIVIPKDNGMIEVIPDNLNMLVREVNAVNVTPGDYLSDHVYFYNGDSEAVTSIM